MIFFVLFYSSATGMYKRPKKKANFVIIITLNKFKGIKNPVKIIFLQYTDLQVEKKVTKNDGKRIYYGIASEIKRKGRKP